MLKVFFWYLILKIFVSQIHKFGPNGNTSISSLFCWPFCYHSNGKNKINARILHLGYYQKNWLKATFSFWLQRGKISPQMHVALCYYISNIEKEKVLMYLSNIDISKATGTDVIGPRLLQLVVPQIAEHVTFICNFTV